MTRTQVALILLAGLTVAVGPVPALAADAGSAEPNDESTVETEESEPSGNSSSVTTFQLLASEVGYGLGGALFGGTVGGLGGLLTGGSFVLLNPDVRTQSEAGRVVWGSVGVGAGIGVVTGLPFGVFVGGDRLGADGKQHWATIGSLLGAAAAGTTWGLTFGRKEWLPARIAVLPLPLIGSIAAFEISRPPDDELENQAAPIFSQRNRGVQVFPVFSATATAGSGQPGGVQLGIIGSW